MTLQAHNSSNTSKIEGGCINHSSSTDQVVTPFMQETISKNTYELCSNNNKRPIYEERRLQIKELDECQTQKSRTPDKSKLIQDKLNTSPNQIKVGDKVLLDAVDPYIGTPEPNEEIPLTVFNIFPYCTVEVIHPKFDIFKVNNTRLKPYVDKVDSRDEECTMPSSRGKKTVVPASKKRKGAASSSGPTMEIRHLFLQVPLGPQEELYQILRARPLATYDPSRSKVSALPPSLRYLHTILAHTLVGRRESTDVVTTHDTYFLWSMANGHIIDLAYFIALAIRHQTERHRREVISMGPYVTQLAWHFGLLNTMCPQGISSMLSMRMIEKRRGTYPPQYCLVQSTEEEDPEDITDYVPPRHEDPLFQPPPPSRPVHAAPSYADIFERLTRLEQ
ncbi:hypothetical protein GOBAR_AA17092 [Gossypium barbadense]|uniref:Uncharacterized protein n=1 Tax=Gossypium barbadense TaxID=3634 RepID=A0A2P5XJW4_GOSBA|nr:hypothetical protein GOBAR_AA17092 [Gossypium barbadense]